MSVGTDPRAVVASAARTVTGTSGSISIHGDTPKVNIAVNVTAVSGTTPVLDLTVEWSDDGGTTWWLAEPADAFTQITAVKTAVKQFAVKAPAYRIRWTIGGTTPSFTFLVFDYLTTA